ncbi:MAG TPA: alpha-L-fucosidase [Anaerolineaceae bacterium]
MTAVKKSWRWFAEARFGLFIHWGAYSQYGRGEQVLFRDHLDQEEYARSACAWNPQNFQPDAWANLAKRAGCRYAVLTTRHHDGFCLWNTQTTDYSTAAQAAQRDFVQEYLTAFRKAGLRVGLYYSLADWRIPAYWEGKEKDPAGWEKFCRYVHEQVRELVTNYGKIDLLWFDGAWPHSALDWQSPELVEMIRKQQPDILINNRLGLLPVEGDPALPHPDGGKGVGESITLGDFGTPEHQITAESGRLWESCQVSTWRLWGYAAGERWRPADLLLDMLVECASKGGNLLLNVGPKPDGSLPSQFVERMEQIGAWMSLHSEAIYGSEAGEVCEFITYGRQTRKGNSLYLVIRFWDGSGQVRLAGLATKVLQATLLSAGSTLPFHQSGDELVIYGLPVTSPDPLFPVIRLDCAAPPKPVPWAADRLWSGDPSRMIPWAKARGSGFGAAGTER